MFTEQDIVNLRQRGISPEEIDNQIKHFKNGFPYLDIIAPATKSAGIRVLSEDEISEAEDIRNRFTGEVCKFVPASGAATRMFKDLFEAFKQASEGKTFSSGSTGDRFIKELVNFPFYSDLERLGINSDSSPETILQTLLYSEGLGYGTLPKGLIKFHKYSSFARTPFEEHLVEASRYALSADGIARMVVTVSEEHMTSFRSLMESVKSSYEKRYGCRYDILFTMQKSSTDTIAVGMDNEPVRDKNGKILFRPAGHGALIENLNDIISDVVIIKNIDNVTREELSGDTIKWKRVQTGILLKLRDQIYNYLNRLDCSSDNPLLEEVTNFLKRELNVVVPNVPDLLRKDFLRAKLNRPIRVCGMVKNEGEPGGGPYIVRDADGSTSLQILESAQLNSADEEISEMVKRSTHFNPVDLTCCFTDYRGNKFDLRKFSDPETGFISEKSVEGKPIKALELPGLWNGAMSQWNTVFVEVPLTTFTPVKTVFDLLRAEHQSA
ncbi:MAG: DUF4301 family protein [Bacteroidales bacterium]